MTITLHWWMVPLGLTVLGVFLLVMDGRQGGYASGLIGGVAFTACIAAALAFTLGHYS